MSEVSGRLLSVVVPCYNEVAGLDALIQRLEQVLEGLAAYRYEVVFVDDGSTDGTLSALQAHVARNPRLVAIELSRNFGKEAALTAGIEAARGDAVVPIDADLQHPPELIPRMVALWESGFDVVLARRSSRETDTRLHRTGAKMFYGAQTWLSRQPMPRDVGDFRLMDRCVVEALKRLPERRRLMKGLFSWVGFKTTMVEFEPAARTTGSSAFGKRRLLRLALDGIASVSNLPLTVWTYVGVFVASLALAYGSWIVVKTLLYGVEVPGYASLLTAVLFLGGVQLLSIGVLGAYLGRVYDETKQRPVYLVRRRYGAEAGDDRA